MHPDKKAFLDLCSSAGVTVAELLRAHDMAAVTKSEGFGFMVQEEKAKAAYEEISEGAPSEAPRWEDLHSVERRHLVEFARALLWREDMRQVQIGKRTMAQVFRPTNMTNLGDMQAVMDAVEKALSE